MTTALSSIIRASTRNDNKYNILCFPTHCRFDCVLAQSFPNSIFYHICTSQIKLWQLYDEMPKNIITLNQSQDGKINLPEYLEFDAILIHNRDLQMNIGLSIAKQLQLPVIHVHSQQNEKYAYGDINITNGFKPNDTFETIYPFVDSKFSQKRKSEIDENKILCVMGRDNNDNTAFVESACSGLPHTIINKNNSVTIDDLLNLYRTHRIFLNGNLQLPIPYPVIEAMSAGCVVVSPKNEILENIIEHGKNGYLFTQAEQLRLKLEELCNKANESVGIEAYKSMQKHNEKQLYQWKYSFNKINDYIYTGQLHE